MLDGASAGVGFSTMRLTRSPSQATMPVDDTAAGATGIKLKVTAAPRLRCAAMSAAM